MAQNGGSNDKRSGPADDFNPAKREVGTRSRPEAQGSRLSPLASFCDAIGIRGQILHSLYQFRTFSTQVQDHFYQCGHKSGASNRMHLADGSFTCHGILCLRPPAETRHRSSLPLFLLDMVPDETL